MWHAASDGTELQLLERAAEIWRFGLTLYKSIGEFRTASSWSRCSLADQVKPTRTHSKPSAQTLSHHSQSHCRPVKQAVSADKGMILNAVLAI
jgi:hypothetical protein